jgi:dTDP-4-dehydrorhamnose reductase
MTKILVTGAAGQLGRTFQDLAAGPTPFQWFFPDRTTLDLTAPEQVARWLREHRPAFVINAGAYTAVDRAEEEPEKAWQVNAAAVEHLAVCCRENGAHLVHLSTDYVYADRYNRPLLETDDTHPQGVYGASKLAGEQAVLRELPSATILRTAWVYGAHGHNFVKTMLRLGRERGTLRVVSDQIGSPTYTRDLAGFVLDQLARVAQGSMPPTTLSGIFNYSNEGVCSWYDFARAIFALAGVDCHVTPIESKEYPTPARRPHFSLLSKAKVKSTFGLTVPYWRDSLQACLQELGESSS